jgi:hypothetical protein
MSEPARETAGVEAVPEVERVPAPRARATAAQELLGLQSAIGNRAVGRMVAAGDGAPGAARTLARRPTQVRVTRDEQRTGTLGVYRVQGAYEVDLSSGDCELTVRVKLVPDHDVTQAQTDQVKADTEAQFLRFWDNKFYFDDERTTERFFLRVKVLWVTSGQHVRVRLRKGPGRDDQTTWFATGSDPVDRAHELSHTLGLFDEYIDSTARRRRTATSAGVFRDHSLMGDYYTEGRAQAEVKLRHGQELARRIGAATRRRLSAHFTGNYQGERLVRWRGIRDAAAAGSAERTAAQAEVTAIESDLLIPMLGGP